MTPEELDKARAMEAQRLWGKQPGENPTPSVLAARLAREGWTPPEPEPVDPDLLAFREWYADGPGHRHKADVIAGHWDTNFHAQAFLAGFRMAREQERERAWVLVEYVQADTKRSDLVGDRARAAVAKYEDGGR